MWREDKKEMQSAEQKVKKVIIEYRKNFFHQSTAQIFWLMLTANLFF